MFFSAKPASLTLLLRFRLGSLAFRTHKNRGSSYTANIALNQDFVFKFWGSSYTLGRLICWKIRYNFQRWQRCVFNG